MLKKLTRTQVQPTVKRLLELQGGVCAVCKTPIEPGQAVLDHDHQTGMVRGVLDRWCNGQLGKVENAAIRAKRTLTHLQWLKNAVHFLETAQTDLMYPTHLTPEEKRAKRTLQERKRRAQVRARRTTLKTTGGQNGG